MTIECPQCQEKCELETDSIPPQGIEITCSSCGMAFRMRPYEGLDNDRQARPASAAPCPSSPIKSDQPDAAPDRNTDFPVHIFQQADEMPFWMVAAYGPESETAFGRQTGADADEEFLAQDIRAQAAEKARDLPILIDDDVVGGDSGPELGLPPLAASRIRTPRRPQTQHLRKILVRIGIAAAVCGLLAATVVLSIFIWKEARGTIGKLAGRASAVLKTEKGDVGKLQFSNLGHEFISRGKNEPPVFVIEGKVTNTHSQSCHSIQVKGILFDERGKKTAEKTVFCGNLLKKEEVQSYPPERIEKVLQNVYGSGLSNFDVEPGGSIPFLLVFFKPPEKVSEFSVEVADYQLKVEAEKPAKR